MDRRPRCNLEPPVSLTSAGIRDGQSQRGIASKEGSHHDSWLRPEAMISTTSAMLCPNEVLADRFKIVHFAGAGGMGAIYSATDTQTGLLVAIKVVTSLEPDGVERLRREARVLADLQHPCIVRHLGSGATHNGWPFLVMEWLDGEDLSVRLARSRLAIDESLAVVRRIALAAAAAHERGIVHRDIKPSNIFLPGCDFATAKLLDFGAARRLEDSGRLLTQPGTVLGTAGYMAPEQALGTTDLDARADVFALGCVLYECLTGQPAFGCANAIAGLLKMLHEEPPRASELVPNLHVGFDVLLVKMLAKDPRRRLSGAIAVLDALTELEHAVGHECNRRRSSYPSRRSERGSGIANGARRCRHRSSSRAARRRC